jgi:hypothetical protein
LGEKFQREKRGVSELKKTNSILKIRFSKGSVTSENWTLALALDVPFHFKM